MEKDLMIEKFVLFDVDADSKEQVVEKLANAMEADGRFLNKEQYLEDVKTREGQSSTAVGMNIATPHAKSTSVKTASLGFARLKHPIQWDENEKVEMVFLIAVPSPGQGNRHLQIISGLFRQMVYEEFLDKLKSVTNEEDIVKLIGNV